MTSCWCVLRWHRPFALLSSRQLLFTERLLDLLPDDELASICAHELAHLTESKKARYARSIRILTFLPWMFFNPLIHNFGVVGFLRIAMPDHHDRSLSLPQNKPEIGVAGRPDGESQ